MISPTPRPKPKSGMGEVFALLNLVQDHETYRERIAELSATIARSEQAATDAAAAEAAATSQIEKAKQREQVLTEREEALAAEGRNVESRSAQNDARETDLAKREKTLSERLKAIEMREAETMAVRASLKERARAVAAAANAL